MELKEKILIAITEFSNSGVINFFIGFFGLLFSGLILIGFIIRYRIRLLEDKNEFEKIERIVKGDQKYGKIISAVFVIAGTLLLNFILIKIFF